MVRLDKKSGDGPFDMIHYPDVVKGNELAIGPFVINNEGDFLVSFSASVHFGAVGFVSAGFNVTEFFERLFE
ncbi:MAG: hypothetical protein IKD31_03165 [Clostridia bacterium]|nr:hypothetical protein [Clostridia bacterium]